MGLKQIPFDWHIHTRNSPCGHPAATMAQVAAAVETSDITAYGVSDHLHSAMNVPALYAGRQAFDALPESTHRYFGVEVSCIREYDLAIIAKYHDADSLYGAYGDRYWGGPEGPLTLYLPDTLAAELAFDYVIGSTHWTLGLHETYTPEEAIRCCHRQNMFLATHPRVDVVAHPWQWSGAWQGADGQYRDYPWFDDFGRIPLSMHDEFAAAVCEHDTAVEINAQGVLLNPSYPAAFHAQYLDYLAMLKSCGVRFALGSDSHAPMYRNCLPEILPEVQALGMTMDDLWQPKRG